MEVMREGTLIGEMNDKKRGGGMKESRSLQYHFSHPISPSPRLPVSLSPLNFLECLT